MEDLRTLSDDTIRRLAELLRRETFQPINSPRPPSGSTHQHAKSGPRVVRRARTCTSTEHPTYPTAPANCYVVELGEMVPSGDIEPGQVDFDFEPYDPAEYRLAFVCDDADCAAEYLPEGTLVYVELHHGRWWIQQRNETRAEICLSEDHPGAGVKFAAKLGHWDATLEKWCYDDAPTVKGIDFREGVPYPDAGARGMATARRSDTEGTLWELDNLDCVSPGACPLCIGD
jgi:hypothetical protein